MLRPLEALVGAVARSDPQAHYVFVGDYVNRGPDSRRVIDLLLSLSRATFLRGNHDDIFDLLLSGQCCSCHASAPDPVSAFAWFMQHGLAETLMSYGADWAELESLVHRPSPRRVEQLMNMVPARHQIFIRSLRLGYEADDFFVVHGFWNPDQPDDSPSPGAQPTADPRACYEMLWERFTHAEIHRKKRWKRTGYFGHTPVFNYRSGADAFTPIRGEKIVLLDTAVALSAAGMLSAVCPETGAVMQADQAGTITELS